MTEWETFCDECYYHMWRVRRKGERHFDDGFHVNNRKEAQGLVELLNGLERERDEAREPLGFFDATNAFIESGLLHYANHSAKDLTQVFMHGPFAGWSERQVVELMRRMDENRKLYRLAMEPSRDTNTEGGPK